MASLKRFFGRIFPRRSFWPHRLGGPQYPEKTATGKYKLEYVARDKIADKLERFAAACTLAASQSTDN